MRAQGHRDHKIYSHPTAPIPSSIANRRSHQLAVYEVALRTNTIAVLETGSGKTMISVMLVKHFGEELKKRGDQRLILFLAPTVHLVVQVVFRVLLTDYSDFVVS
ncbi:hypothetical protein BHM03_00026506 [Ensete ventricosum]|nr:hypothetical protein BHM03_00026506 [Ensete ventricosum]